jgi:hypothetical protein
MKKNDVRFTIYSLSSSKALVLKGLSIVASTLVAGYISAGDRYFWMAGAFVGQGVMLDLLHRGFRDGGLAISV